MRALLGLALVFVFFWGFINWSFIKDFPKILPTYYAKQYCSCYFVMELGEKNCQEWSKQWMPFKSFKLSKAKKRVVVQGYGAEASSVFISPRYGCILEE